MSGFRNKSANELAPYGTKAKKIVNVLPGTSNGEVVTYDTLVNNSVNAATTGDNTHSGTETFTNATGVTTATITPATSGAGTSFLRPAGRLTTTPIAATALKSGGVYTLAKADGITVALPALATATIGTTFKFHVETTSTSGGYIISTGEAGDVFFGGLYATIAAGSGAAADSEFNIASGTNNTLTLGATTACGLAGGYFEITAVSATQWAISGTVLGSGAIASNLFTTV